MRDEQLQEQMQEKKTGTTNVVVTYEDGVVLGTDKRATMGRLIDAEHVRKVFKIQDHIGMTVAGSVGDIQAIVRYMRAETNLYQLKGGEKINVRAAATLLANILQGSKYFPYLGQFTIGGVDSKDGAQVIGLDPLGGLIDEENYKAAGSGTPYALGVLEDNYEEDMNRETAVHLTLRAIRAAKRRDTASGGDGYMIAVVDEDGYEELSEEDIESHLEE